ncbi:nicotinamidase [Idiomarina aminovorans]|uniref:nicotinamidase n=1 Tax=Idiomarina aminovorans TaxID=2914829 RepID=UPI002002B9D3|nr:nicotinamidase [Idiomarina sp. ATCH4]MCK7460355.1 nicotinamidase [Idiomarina sp. ATCH4]
MKVTFQPNDVLIVVDVQNDFCPGGKLALDEGDEVVPVINAMIAQAQESDIPVFVSRDWHPRHHVSFDERGGSWPEHCVQGTKGAEFHPDLSVPDNARLVSKGARFDIDQYSAFDKTGLVSELVHMNVKRVWVVGLALEVCVKATALDAVKNDYETLLVEDGTRFIDRADAEKTRAELKDAGVIFK